MAWGSGIAIKLVGDYGEEKITGVATVQLQPVRDTYPTNAVSMSQGSYDTSVWLLASDSLTDDMHYLLYIDGVDAKVPPYTAPNSRPAIG